LILIEARATASQTGDIQQKEAPLLAHQFVDDPGAYFNADEPLIQSRSRREKKFVNTKPLSFDEKASSFRRRILLTAADATWTLLDRPTWTPTAKTSTHKQELF